MRDELKPCRFCGGDDLKTMNDDMILQEGEKLQYHCNMNEDGTNNGSLFVERFKGQAYCIAKAPKYASREEWEHNAQFIIKAISLYNADGDARRETHPNQQDG